MKFRVAISFDYENCSFFAKVALTCQFYDVFLRVGVRILEKTEVKMLAGSAAVSGETSRALYQHRKNPYSWHCLGNLVCFRSMLVHFGPFLME